MRPDLRRLVLALLLAFGVVALSTAYWSILRADGLAGRQDNARRVIRAQQVARGTIYDRQMLRLAYSVPDARGIMRRVVPDPAVAAGVGYYSFTYGAAGIEAAYNAELSGTGRTSGWRGWWDRVLHRAPRGADVRATLDLDVQRAVADALACCRGAAVVVEVPSGAVLGMVSLPGYDPNTIDADWRRLTGGAPGGDGDAELVASSPLLNRAIAGLYQPGGALQPVVLAALLASHVDLSDGGVAVLNAGVPRAQEPVAVNGLELRCLVEPGAAQLSLIDAFALGCPAPFVRAEEFGLTPERLWERLNVLGLLSAPDLPGFETIAGPQPQPLDADTPEDVRAAALAGQADLTVTPLQMVRIVAAIANGGNAVPLQIVEAVRAPGTAVWEPVAAPAVQPALLRADVAAALRSALRTAAQRSPQTVQAQSGGQTLFGHVALAYAGPQQTPYAWFLGFAELPGDAGRAIAVVVVIEDEADPGVAATVARAAFAAAAQ